MESLTAQSVDSLTLQIAQYIGSIIEGLDTLKGKYGNADATIRTLISHLSAIKAAALQIRDWAKYSFDESPKTTQFLDALSTSLNECQITMEVVWDEVRDLAASVRATNLLVPLPESRAQPKSWNTELMKSYQNILHGQIDALQLLVIAASKCDNDLEQTRTMMLPENQRAIRKVIDDADSTAGSRSSATSEADRSPRISVADGAYNELDYRLDYGSAQTVPYQSLLRRQDTVRSTVPSLSPLEMIHEGTPIDDVKARNSILFDRSAERLPRAQTMRQPPIVAPPQPITRYQLTDSVYNVPLPRSMTSRTSKSEPGIDRWGSSTSPPSDKASTYGEKRSLASRLKRTFSKSQLPPPAQRSNSAGATFGAGQRLRKAADMNKHHSIDISSPDGIDAPPLVRNAQAGNIIEIERLLEGSDDIESRHELTQRTALAVAAHCGAFEVATLLVHRNARLDTRDIDQSTPLHLAASRGHTKIMGLLLDYGAEIEAADINKKTALWVTSDRGYTDAARMLLERAAKVNTRIERASNHMTALQAATKHGDKEMVELLLKYNALIEARDGASMTALHYACEYGHLEIAAVLIQKGASIEAQGKHFMTPLLCAAAAGRLDLVNLLLKKKAELRSVDSNKANALHWASKNGHLEVAQCLLTWKMPIHTPNVAGFTALHLAVLGSHFHLVDFLLQRRASVEGPCRDGRTAIHMACAAQSPEIVNLLLNAGANITAPTPDGQQPIHIAAANGAVDILDILHQRGAKLDVRDPAGDRPLCIACKQGHVEAVERLLSYRSPLRMPYKNRPSEDSPLCIAAKAGHANVVQLLLQKGDTVKQRDGYGYVPLRYATSYAHPAVVEVLLRHGAGVADVGEDSSDLAFMLNPNTVVFSKDGANSDERKQLVRQLLRDAFEAYHDEDGDNEFA